MTARLSLLDQEEQASPWGGYDNSGSPHLGVDRTASESHDRSPWGSQHSIQISAPQELYMQGIPSNPYAEAPAVVVQPSDPTGDPYGLYPSQSHGRLGSDAGAHTPSAFSSATSATSHELIDLDSPDRLGIEGGSQKAGSSVYSFEGLNMEKQPSGSQPTSETPSISKPSQSDSQSRTVPRIRAPLTPAEEARQQEQRAETYSIRKINWQNQKGDMIKAPILVQNKNGPCPLLALINALVLQADTTSQPPIVKALQTREQISLGLLIEAVFEELITRLGPEASLPDIEALAQFLTMLHTGMNVNPRLTPVSVSFEHTQLDAAHV